MFEIVLIKKKKKKKKKIANIVTSNNNDNETNIKENIKLRLLKLIRLTIFLEKQEQLSLV